MVETPRKIEGAANGLDELKSLLFQGESRRLAELERDVAHLDQRVGDAPKLVKATAEVIVEALRRAEVDRHRELAAAIAPVVVAAIRNEIRNSRPMMVEALYPLTGQLVVAAVQNAFRELVASLNQRVDSLTSVDRWKLRLRSRLTGTPISELALARTAREKILRALFLEAGSGRLIASWRADAQDDERADMVGGLIAAITGFARDALDAGANELRTLDFGGRKTYLRNSAQTIVAAETEGELSHEQIVAFEAAFLDLVESHAGDEAREDALARFAARVNEAVAEQKKAGVGLPLKILATVALLALAGLAWRAGMRAWQDKRIGDAVASVVAQRPHLAAFPISAIVRHGDSRVEVKGLLPSTADAEALVAALKPAAGDYTIDPRFAVLASSEGVEAIGQRAAAAARDLEDLRRDLAAIGERATAIEAASRDTAATQRTEAQARLDALAEAGASNARLDELRARVDVLATADAEARRLNEAVTELGRKLIDVTARLDAPPARLASLVDGFAVFFSDGDAALNEPSVRTRLDAIAELLRRESMGIRLIGHTDAAGSPARNQAISRARAEVVARMLTERGVDRGRIVIVSRAANAPIADADSAARERNRRVTLEPLLHNEESP